jgi:gliding motility-associated-like protein
VKNKKTVFLFILNFIFSLPHCFGQKERKNWYFGTGTDGIIFDNKNNPIKVSNKYAGVGYEGMIVVNDPVTGDLKFYSDGVNVIDNNHNIMTNGTGLFGNFSGAQDVQCCPLPGSCAKKYYLFTNSAYDFTPGDISYSIVDFTSNPLGVVTQKNTPLWSGPSDQGMCLVNRPNSNDYWIIANTFELAVYNVFPVTAAGIGTPKSYTFSNNGSSYQINYSSTAKKIVVTGGLNLGVTVINFDAITGVLSNEVQLLPVPLGTGGARFSPDGTKLYVGVDPPTINLEQYDFKTATWAIMNSCCFAHDLSMGPDGKMYHIHTYNDNQPISVIDFPNNSAIGNACNFHSLTFSTDFDGEVRRFPEFVTLPPPPIANWDTITTGAMLTTNIFVMKNDSDLQGDPIMLDSIIYGPKKGTASISGNCISYISNASAGCGFTDTLIYRIKDINCAYDTTLVIIKINALISPLVNSNSPVCAGGALNLTASTLLGAVYKWTGPNGFTSALQNPCISPVTVSNSGTYTLIVSGNGCMSAPVSIAVVVNPQAVPLVNSNSPVCAGGVLNFTASNFLGAIYSWTGPNGFKSFLQNPSINPFNPSNFGTYTLTVNSSGCLSIPVSINVTGDPLPKVNLGKDTVFCEGESILLDAGVGYKYHWWNGVVVQTQVIAEGGIYFVTVNNQCGAASDTIVIDEMDCSMEIFFPNSFTPNGDYTNQIWHPKGVNIEAYEVLIYDRWGELIFKSNSLAKGWDGTYNGKDCESDVYCYVAKYADKMHADKLKMKTRKGVITLVR